MGLLPRRFVKIKFAFHICAVVIEVDEELTRKAEDEARTERKLFLRNRVDASPHLQKVIFEAVYARPCAAHNFAVVCCSLRPGLIH